MKRTIFINVHVKLIDSFNYFNALRGKGGSFHRYHTIDTIVLEAYTTKPQNHGIGK